MSKQSQRLAASRTYSLRARGNASVDAILFSPAVDCDMRPALRYAASIAVGLAVAIPVGELASGDWLITISLIPLYATTTSMGIAHRERWMQSNDDSPSRLGAAVGGVGALTGGALIRTSIPAATAGFGLLLLGMAAAIAMVDKRG